jgi:hypothetical protein
MECTDHLGQKFKTKTEMCKHWGVGFRAFCSRIRGGLDLETALTSPVSPSHRLKINRYTDHQGNKFSTKAEMCKYWGVDCILLNSRLSRGWDLEKALTTPIGAVYKRVVPKEPVAECEITDHLGNKFHTKSEMCRYWKVDLTLFVKRAERGYSLKECLVGRKIKDHLGNEFNDLKEMCDYWGIEVRQFKSRRNQKKSLEQCLTDESKFVIYDYNGIKFNTLTEMCKYHNVKIGTYESRKRKGWNTKECLLGK